MISRMWTKHQTQATIKTLRDAGIVVNKTPSGYKAEQDGVTIFQAMNGSRGYLVSYSEDLFAPN